MIRVEETEGSDLVHQLLISNNVSNAVSNEPYVFHCGRPSLVRRGRTGFER